MVRCQPYGTLGVQKRGRSDRSSLHQRKQASEYYSNDNVWQCCGKWSLPNGMGQFLCPIGWNTG